MFKKIKQHLYKDKHWILVIIMIKFIIFSYLAHQFHKSESFDLTGSFFVISNDTETYYQPLESLSRSSGYSRSTENGNYVPVAYRMPGLAPIYIPLRLVFSEVTTKNLIIFLQLLLSTISVYLLAKSAELISSKRFLFIITALLYAVNIFISIYDHFGLSDSFSISFLIFSLFFFAAFLKNKNLWLLFISGCFLTWSVFIRPISGPLFLSFITIYTIYHYRYEVFSFKRWIKLSFIFSSSFLLCTSLWIFRNYAVFDEIIPLQRPLNKVSQSYPEQKVAIYEFIIAQGEDFVPWVNQSFGEWFFTEKENYKLDRLTYTSAFNKDSIHHLKQYYQYSISNKISLAERKKFKELTEKLALKYTLSLKKEKPFIYYVSSKTSLLYKFLFPGQYTIQLPFPSFNDMNLLQKSIKGGSFLFLYFITLTGLAGIILSFFYDTYLLKYFSLLPVTFIIALVFIKGYIELRYYAPVYSLLNIFAAYTVYLVYMKWKQIKGGSLKTTIAK